MTHRVRTGETTVYLAEPDVEFAGDGTTVLPPAPEESGRGGEKRVGSTVTPVQIAILALGAVAFLYFAKAVCLPVTLAGVAGMALKPLVRLLSKCRLPPAVGAAIVLGFFSAAVIAGFVELGKPAVVWMNDTPRHIAELKKRFAVLFRPAARVDQVATAMKNFGTTEEDRKKVTTVEIQTGRVPSGLINWTGTFLAAAGETLVLLYLLLASGDLYLQKLVKVMPTLRDKKRAVEINRQVQQNVSHYLFSVSLINIGLGAAVAAALFWIGVPNAAMWGALAALLNYLPYFGPIAGVVLLAMVGTLTFDGVWRGLLPAAVYLILHLFEANFITPAILGRRFTVSPVVVFVSLIFWTWMWGVPGALLAGPILISFKVLCDRVDALAPVGELLAGRESQRSNGRDEAD